MAAMMAIMAFMIIVRRYSFDNLPIIETARAAATPPPRQGGAHVYYIGF